MGQSLSISCSPGSKHAKGKRHYYEYSVPSSRRVPLQTASRLLISSCDRYDTKLLTIAIDGPTQARLVAPLLLLSSRQLLINGELRVTVLSENPLWSSAGPQWRALRPHSLIARPIKPQPMFMRIQAPPMACGRRKGQLLRMYCTEKTATDYGDLLSLRQHEVWCQHYCQAIMGKKKNDN